jgi:hypothetical protein
LVADADTTIRESEPDTNRGGNGLEIRSLTGVRQRSAYIRFDLRVLGTEPQSNIVLTVTRDEGGRSVEDGQLKAYGVLDLFGNTSQGWQEYGLTYASTGLEVPGDDDMATQDIDTNRLAFLGGFPESGTTAGETMAISNPALDAFIIDRYNNGGQATLYLVEDDGIERTVYLSHNGGDYPPTLDVVSTLQALPPDTTPPTVAGTAPLPGAAGVSVNTEVRAWFSEPMDEASITNGTVFFLLDGSSSTVTAAVVYNPNTLTLTLTPGAPLEQDTVYTGTVLGSLTDTNSNPLGSDFSWSFTTELDTVPPVVVAVSPTNTQADVVYYTKVNATFDEDMAPDSFGSNSFYLVNASSSPVPASLVYVADTRTAHLSPQVTLNYGETYTATLLGGAGGVTDLVGNPLATTVSWSFAVETFDPGGAVTLVPVADSYTRTGVGAGAAENLDTRDFGTAGGDFVSYVRFDLAALGVQSISQAALVLHETAGSRNDFIVTGRHAVFGLTDATGNTVQAWDESTDLVPGAEYANTGGDLVDTNQVFVLDADRGANVTETIPGNDNVEVTTEGEDMVAFLNGRLAAGGLATFILVCDAGTSGRGYGFASRENLIYAPPRLTLRGTIKPQIAEIALADGPEIVVTWPGSVTHTYGVERAGDLTAGGWVSVASNLAGAGVNTYTDTVPVEVQAVYRVLDEGAPEYFFDDFEGDDLGWMVVTGAGHVADTDWQRGTPSSGPGAAYSGANCYGTNLGGDYGANADIGLLSPVIDLTATTGAELSFAHYYDTEVLADGCTVFIRDAAGAPIAGLESPIATYEDFITAWQTVSLSLPVEAVGRSITVEFRFTSDSGVEYAGWYLDDVKVAR